MLTAATSGSAAPDSPTLVGPLLSSAETPGTSWARDGGVSLQLPNGRTFWIFGDSPRFQWIKGRWRMNAFILGSTAAQRRFTPGKLPAGPLNEVLVGHPTRATNQPRQFLPSPKLYMPDGSGRPCNRANGGSKAQQVRWVTGMALMPDRKNVLIPYVEVCVLGEFGYHAEGWGFTLYNYKTNKFSMKPYTVFPASPDGAPLSSQVFGSPIIKGGKVTFYSWAWKADGGIYTTTMKANVAALKKRKSYVPELAPDLPLTLNVNVSRPSKTHAKITMYVLTGSQGEYDIYAASTPTGPWSKVASGQLPGCDSSPLPCRSFALHPELSPAKRLIVSYYLHGFGPGIATKHPAPPDQPMPHTVLASIPCAC